MGNKAVTMATNVLYNCWISDVMTCHKAMSTELFRSLRLRERGFAIEPEIAARVLQSGERIYEVPIGYAARSRDEGKKLTALDGLRVLRTLVRCRARSSAPVVRTEDAYARRRRASPPSRPARRTSTRAFSRAAAPSRSRRAASREEQLERGAQRGRVAAAARRAR